MYQRETRLWPQAGRCPDSRLGAFHLTHANIDLRLLAEDVTKQGGGGLQWVGSREREFSAPLPRLLSSSSPYPEESDSGGVSSPRLPPPPCPHSRPTGTPKPHPLSPCLLPFVVDTVGLPPHHNLRQGGPPWSAVHIPKTLHKNVYVLKNQKLTQPDENELKQTHPRADDPFS
jgi:hypothetical protein